MDDTNAVMVFTFGVWNLYFFASFCHFGSEKVKTPLSLLACFYYRVWRYFVILFGIRFGGFELVPKIDEKKEAQTKPAATFSSMESGE